MGVKNISGLYVGKPVGRYHILSILPQTHDLRIECVASDGNIWRFDIDERFPDLKIGVVNTLKDRHFKWIDEKIAYCIVKYPEVQRV